MTRFNLIFILLILCCTSLFAKDSDKVDIKNFEKNYWMAKDKNFQVVQNRFFTKKKRVSFDFTVGTLINDSFSVGQVQSFASSYFFDEAYGIRVSYSNGILTPSVNTQSFKDRFGTTPDYNRFLNATDIAFVWSPIYAKLSLLDKKILYFDMMVSLGIGVTEYEQQLFEGAKKKQATHISLDVMQYFFINRNYAIRLDIKNSWSSQERVKFQVQANDTSARSLGSRLHNDTVFAVGLAYFL